MPINPGMMSSNKSDWETPEELFRILDDEFHFTLDVCATDDNKKCKNFFDPSKNGLIQPWAGNVCWCNPPYGREYPKWIHKGYKEVVLNKITAVYLLPARTDTEVFHRYIMTADEIRFVRGRICFSGGGPAPFPSMVVVMRPHKNKVPKISTMLLP